MRHADRTHAAAVQALSLESKWLWRSIGPLLIAVVAVIVLAGVVVFATKSAWQLLGVGRGFVPPRFYHYSGLFVVLGTTFGQFIGWAGGSALLAYLWRTLIRQPITLRVVQVSTSIVYLGMAVLPIFVYHLLFGQPLAGIPRPGLVDWLREYYPDAYTLLLPGHRLIDFLIVPLMVAVLALIWGSGERLIRHRGMQTLVLFLILVTSLAVAMSLAIHSTLAHIRLG